MTLQAKKDFLLKQLMPLRKQSISHHPNKLQKLISQIIQLLIQQQIRLLSSPNSLQNR